MLDENEQAALSKIKAYLDSGHSLDDIREVGWASWIDHLEAKGYEVRDGQLALRPPEDEPENRTQSALNLSVTSGAEVPICAKCGSSRVGNRPRCKMCQTEWPDGTPPGSAVKPLPKWTWPAVSIGVAVVILIIIVGAVAGDGDPSTGGDASSYTVLEQSEAVFKGGYSEEEIKRVLDRTMNLYGLSITEGNYDRATSVLVALRQEFGVREMDTLDYMIRSHVPGINLQFHEAASIAVFMLSTGADY